MHIFFIQKEDTGATVEKNQTVVDEKLMTFQESLKASEPSDARNKLQMEMEPGDGSHVEYTELTLDCLDLKAQEALLSPPHSGNKSIKHFTDWFGLLSVIIWINHILPHFCSLMFSEKM